MTKVLFEGQTRKLPSLMILKAVFPSKLGNEEFANYLKVTKGQSANSNTNLINEYVHDKNP